ncbi:O-acetylhomoserine aminocarboxypropyltransferase/cysteine synthase family protein [Rhodomicrobium lacus]|uniref:O-acetylhomoserine aminocarboxypropyltransferase/cysteine synthase family protein n=1 Tax=Rhodomicrobium lacus TaxID=2498452 RepID=UPI0026E1F20F|nr:O-acetylhomoserine aminocarboxypropyltransferase/cysteine synthase family protein [Rhodomicrobium lacus]WKW52138.1 O-acetylhomoserine aminocarboxypropyltransferase/cysteine synthase [Rhodomicrobium lacus]
MSERQFGFATQQLHAGQTPDPATGARAVPIYQTTSFVFKDFAAAKAISSVEEFGFDYTRITNPTNEVLENRIAALEGGTGALSVASGSAATAYSILNITHAGHEIVAAKTLYGGSFNLFQNTLPKHGVKTILVDPADTDSFERAINERTRALFVETIGNPDINIIDFEAVARIAERHGIPLIVDNTFATPYLFRPFDYGANISVHSATKFIGGHGTSIGGLIVDGGNFNWANGKFPDFTTPDPAYSGFVHWDKWGNYPGVGNIAYIIKARLHYLRDFGASLSPFNAFLFLQGLETLSFRLERQIGNAQAIAEWLEANEEVEWVNYPGLRSSPHHELARKYLPKGPGSILTFGVKGGFERAKKLIEAVKIFSFLANVGDSKSLIVHPATVTHGQLTEEEQLLAGVKPNQIRLSVGTEDVDDLIWDLEQAFAASRG